jgi:DNA-binding IclR family transcriptional regulator
MAEQPAYGAGAPGGSIAPSVLLKAFDVLSAFSHRRRVLTLAEIARHSGVPKSTVRRVLAMLVSIGAVEQTAGGYRVGLRMFSLGSLPPEAALREAAMPHLEDLHRVTGQTLHLAVLRGADVVYLEKLPGRRGIATPALIGDRLPANCTAVGKALLAFADEAVLASVIAAPWRRRTVGSLASAGQLRGQLDAIRRDAFATDREESAAGLACMAVPVLAGGRAVAAISVTFPAGAGTGHAPHGRLARAPGPTSTSSPRPRAGRSSRWAARAGQGHHHLQPCQPADDHAGHGVLRDPHDADTGAITASIEKMAEEVRQYVPGYTLRAEPQYDTEVLVATFGRLGIPTGVNVQGVLAAAEEVVKPSLHRLPFADRGAITQGYAGVYSSFLLHAERARPGTAYRRTRPAARRRERLRRRPAGHDHRRRPPAGRRARPRRRLTPDQDSALLRAPGLRALMS